VQRVDLGAALALLLMTNPQREIEQRAKAVLERGIVLDQLLSKFGTTDAELHGAHPPAVG
jgi:hypothetical protein